MAYIVTTAGAAFEYQTTEAGYPQALQIDTTHYLVISNVSNTATNLQVLAVNTSTWAVTTASAQLEIQNSARAGDNKYLMQVDANHFIALWSESFPKLYAQTVVVNTTTWAVTTAAASLEIASNGGKQQHGFSQIDTNHFLVAWVDQLSSDGFAQVIEVNTSTWAITTSGAAFEFDTTDGQYPHLVRVDETHHFLHYVDTSTEGKDVILAVNTTTWAVTTAAATNDWGTTNPGVRAWGVLQDTNKIVLTTTYGAPSADDYRLVSLFTVNTSTWVITSTSDLNILDPASYQGKGAIIPMTDSNRYLTVASDGTNLQAIVVATDADTVSTDSATFQIGAAPWNTTSSGGVTVGIDDDHYLAVWCGTSQDGFAQVLNIPSAAVSGATAGTMPGFMF